MRLLALDFDGVVSDSAPEAFVVALRTWCALRPDTSLAEPACELIEASAAPAPGTVAGCSLYAPFLELMPLGNRAEDYAVTLHALEAGASLRDQAGYDDYKSGIDPEWLREFHRAFYRVRAALSESDSAAWHRLTGPYAGMPELLRRCAADCVLAIASSKDRHSVRKLLLAYGVGELFPEDRVLDKEAGASKRNHLECLQRDHALDFAEMTFVDDKVNHLDDVAPLGVHCVLAGWGYNGPRERELARLHGHTILELADVESALFGPG